MKRRMDWRVVLAVVGMVVVLGCGSGARGAVPAGAVAGFERYVGVVEARLEAERVSGVRLGAGVEERVRRGEVVVEEVRQSGGGELPGALLHHWQGTAFVPGGTATEVERVMRDFGGYARVFAPEVLRAGVVRGGRDEVQVAMRVRQKHVITVVMDTDYDVRFGRVGAGRGWSVSRSTRVAEIEGAGTAKERVLSAADEHGFLWRQNTYWSWEERDGGVVVRVESVSLSRGIPVGLGWVVRPFVESVPRESMEFALRGVCAAVKK